MFKERVFKKKKIIVITAALFALFLFFLLKESGQEVEYEVVSAARVDMREVVSVTGQVIARRDVEAGFPVGGEVRRIYVKAGDRVRRGQTLAELRIDALLASLKEAEANISREEAVYEGLLRGPRIEDIKIKEKELRQAELKRDALLATVPDIVRTAFFEVEDILNRLIDPFFYNDTSLEPRLTFDASSQPEVVALESLRVQAGLAHKRLQEIFMSLAGEEEKDYIDILRGVARELSIIESFLLQTGKVLRLQIDISAADLPTFQGNLDAARTALNQVIESVNDTMQKIPLEEAAVARAESALEAARAKSTAEDLAAQNALVERARAQYQKVSAQIEERRLRAPFDGIIARVDVEVGEIVSAQTPVMKIISSNDYVIEAFVSETEIASIQKGDNADVTLDAYGPRLVFPAVIESLDPAETFKEGVPTYKIILSFEKDGADVRSGMTANIDIVAQEKEKVISIPARAVFLRNGIEYVQVLEDGKIVERKVITGIRDPLGNIEIINGVNEGEQVITFISSS